MTTWLFLMASATVGVDQGWQPIAGGGYEYIIQIEPETLESIKAGRDLFFHLPESLSGVQSYRITSGNEPLPHDGEPLPAIAQTAKTESPNSPRLGEDPSPILKGPETTKSSGAHENSIPRAMTPEPGTKPLETQVTEKKEIVNATRVSPVGASAELAKSVPPVSRQDSAHDRGSPSDDLPKGFDAAGDTEAKPIWMSLNFALMVLFASLGVNLFLGWVTVAQRGRYQSVLARLAVR